MIDLIQWASNAYKTNRYSSVDTYSKECHCYHIYKLNKNLAKQIDLQKQNQRGVNNAKFK